MFAKPFLPEKLATTPVERTPAVEAERRRRTRLQVHWPVCFRGDSLAAEVRTTTSNLSSDGFYCISQIPLAPGAVLTCELNIPAYGPDFPHQELSLECLVRIVRIDSPNDDGHFGIACQITDFHLAHAVYCVDQERFDN